MGSFCCGPLHQEIPMRIEGTLLSAFAHDGMEWLSQWNGMAAPTRGRRVRQTGLRAKDPR